MCEHAQVSNDRNAHPITVHLPGLKVGVITPTFLAPVLIIDEKWLDHIDTRKQAAHKCVSVVCVWLYANVNVSDLRSLLGYNSLALKINFVSDQDEGESARILLCVMREKERERDKYETFGAA
jgi:hypothetical protein